VSRRRVPLPGVLALLLAATAVACGAFVGVLFGAPADDAHLPKYGPRGAPQAVPLSHDHAYVAGAAPAPDFWALIPFYVPQFNEMACSAASVAIVVNGLVRAGHDLGDADRNVTQQDLLDHVTAQHWKARLSLPGYLGAHGLTLAQLRDVTAASLAAYGAPGTRVEMVTAAAGGFPGFRAALAANEASARDFVIVHFVQDRVTLARGGPYAHISPVGAYDAARHRVLLLDVDREYYEPYWVSDEVLWDAMTATTRAFGAGGYIHVGP
jgi:hypothetical protein